MQVEEKNKVTMTTTFVMLSTYTRRWCLMRYALQTAHYVSFRLSDNRMLRITSYGRKSAEEEKVARKKERVKFCIEEKNVLQGTIRCSLCLRRLQIRGRIQTSGCRPSRQSQNSTPSAINKNKNVQETFPQANF